MKKQLSKLGETTLRYFFILNILLGGLFYSDILGIKWTACR